ncbi:MAG: hypothetical protein RR406_02210 [Bacilli bacterium]
MAFVYANPGSGPSAGGIGWFDFSNLVIAPGQSYTNLTGTLNDGSTVTFDIKSIPASIVPFTANTVPRPFSYFGNLQYTGILGNVALTTPLLASYSNVSTLEISNIVVKDVDGNLVTNYTAVVADAESTNLFPQYTEHLTFTTTGNPWSLLSTIGPNPPTIIGVGSNSVTITGTNQSSQAAYVLTSNSPSKLTLETYGREAVAIGFSTTRVTLQKVIGARINSADQFDLNIAGTPNNQVFTTGSASGIQVEKATIYAIPGNTYTINEAMAPGSVSNLSAYTTSTSGVNNTPGGPTPPTGTLPINVTPVLGDEIVYTITNAAPEVYTKTVDKQYSDLGEILTYTIKGHNPNSFPINNVLVQDSTPAGTTYMNNLTVSVPYTGTDPNSGITLTTVAPNSDVTISYQVKVNSSVATNQINNVATVTGPSGIPKNTNIVTTTINNADLTSTGNFNKTVTPTTAKPGDILTYTITMKNTGNVAANNVVLTDIIPVGTTYVAGSTTASLPFTGDATSTIKLTSPIMANTTATVTFKVKVGSTLPVVNPIPNKADVAYTYTVDPNSPNGVAKTGTSNTVTTNIVAASLSTVKTADKEVSYIGEVITYNIAVTNTGNTPLNNVTITDPIPNGTAYIPGSLVVSVPSTGIPGSGITLTNSLLPGATATITFKVTVTSIPNPNPIKNKATTTYKYTLNPLNPDGENGTSISNIATTLIFRNNYNQQINDLIESVALEQAALAAIANSEGAKIQAALAINNITPDELLCINKSVQDMLESINMLETVLKQKLNIVNCQINGCNCC